MRHRVSHFFRTSKTQISHEVTDRREETYSISLKAPDRGTVKTQKKPQCLLPNIEAFSCRFLPDP